MVNGGTGLLLSVLMSALFPYLLDGLIRQPLTDCRIGRRPFVAGVSGFHERRPDHRS